MLPRKVPLASLCNLEALGPGKDHPEHLVSALGGGIVTFSADLEHRSVFSLCFRRLLFFFLQDTVVWTLLPPTTDFTHLRPPLPSSEVENTVRGSTSGPLNCNLRFLIWRQGTFPSPKNGKKETWSFGLEEGCVLKSFLYQSMSGTRGKTELQRVLSFNRRTYACKTHQKYSVWFCKSFLRLFFLPCTCREGGLGAEGSVPSTMTGRVTRLHRLFTIRHVLSNKGQWRQGEETGYWHFTDLVLQLYFTNDLLNLNVHHHKRQWSQMRKSDLLEPQSFGGEVGRKGGRALSGVQVS